MLFEELHVIAHSICGCNVFMGTSFCYMQIENVTLDHLRDQLENKYGQEGEESVSEAWDSMQKLVSTYLSNFEG